MKKVIFGALALLLFGGALIASTAPLENTSTQTSDIEILAEGVDEGGRYVVYSDGFSCHKVYPKSGGSPGMFDH